MKKFLTNISGGQFIGATVGLGMVMGIVGKISPILTLLSFPIYIALFYARAKRLNEIYLFVIYLLGVVGIFTIPSFTPFIILTNLIIFLYLTFKNAK